MSRHVTRDDAIEQEIVAAIEGSGEIADARASYDVDAIADAVLDDQAAGYAVREDVDFWSEVASHAR